MATMVTSTRPVIKKGAGSGPGMPGPNGNGSKRKDPFRSLIRGESLPHRHVGGAGVDRDDVYVAEQRLHRPLGYVQTIGAACDAASDVS